MDKYGLSISGTVLGGITVVVTGPVSALILAGGILTGGSNGNSYRAGDYMYKVISISDDEMTRNIELENSDTGTIEKCFDDSSLISEVNFGFLTIGKEYECKIKLFGNVVQDMQDKTVICKILSKNEMVGIKEMVKVLVENNEYYIPRKKVEKCLDKERFFFRYTRKDLIEVDNVIHSDMLHL